MNSKATSIVPRQLPSADDSSLSEARQVDRREVKPQEGLVDDNRTRALIASELSYRRLFETAKDGILMLDADTGRINDVNPFLFNLLGFSREEMLGKTVGELSPFKDIESNQAMLKRLQKDGYVRYENLPLETRDGRKAAVEFVSNVYQVGDQKVIQCNIRDITERKRAEIASSQLAAIVESSDDAIIGKDPNGIIISWNKGAQKLFGYTACEAVGNSFMRLVPADRQHEEKQILVKIAHGESVEHFETQLQTKGGTLIDVSVTSSPINDAAGKISGISSVARDISERKAAEERICQLNIELEQRVVGRTTELNAAIKELETFSYSVAHDLRAPLRQIMGFVHFLRKEAGASLSEESLHCLFTISQSAKRMGQLIDALLEFSRLGRGELHKTEVNLNELIQDILNDFPAESTDRKILWNIHPLPQVWADPPLLRIALVNLISNAVKFTAHRSAPTVEIGRVPSGNSETVIFFRDNGSGFNPLYTDKLFKVFERLHSEAEFEGTGIGLANVQRIIQRHGGRTWAEGIVDAGATFFFSIPNQDQNSNGH